MKHWSSHVSGLDRVEPRGRRAALLACLLVVAFVEVSLPGGVLLSDATQSWFGEAVTE
jgi:hypothetical protein